MVSEFDTTSVAQNHSTGHRKINKSLTMHLLSLASLYELPMRDSKMVVPVLLNVTIPNLHFFIPQTSSIKLSDAPALYPSLTFHSR
jgi:hypothetical protein